MFINKIGTQHIDIGMNCQDYGLESEDLKIVCDGCSEGKHTEVGAKAYCHLASYGCGTERIFEKLLNIFGQTTSSIKNFLCFTMLSVYETDEYFRTEYCGDGYIILQDVNGDITFEELNDGEFPKYYVYNYCNPNCLEHYKDGVSMNGQYYSKKDYSKVGVASDGLRFIVNADDSLKEEFIELLKLGNEVKVKRFINRNQKIFKDDITIVL